MRTWLGVISVVLMGVAGLVQGCQPQSTSAPKPVAPTAAPAKPAESAAKAPALAAESAAKPPSANEQPSGSGASAELQRVLAAAKTENELNLVWSENSLGGAEGARKFEALLNQMYGTTIKINFTPGPSMPDVAGKVTQELAAGQKATTDILLASEGILAPLIPREILEEYDYSALSGRIGKAFLAPRNAAVEILSLDAGITYNTQLVSKDEVPKTLEDVLNPKWKGKIASTPYATGFERVALRPEWGTDKMKAYISRLSEQVGGLIRSGETNRISSGEFVMLVMDTGTFQADRAAKTGAPVAHTVPRDAATAGFLYLGVPRNSQHPNASKLFINMMMSEDGQKLLYDLYLADHHALNGSRLASHLQQQGVDLTKLLKVDAKFVIEHPEMSQLSDEMEKIMSR